MTAILIPRGPVPIDITTEQVVMYLLRKGWQEPKWYQLARWFDRGDESVRLELCPDGTVAPKHLSAFIEAIARTESRPALAVAEDIAGPVVGVGGVGCGDGPNAHPYRGDMERAKCRMRAIFARKKAEAPRAPEVE